MVYKVFQRAPSPPEFAQPCLSRVKARSSPARGYKFGCVCSYMAGHGDARVVTGHIGTNTPKFVPPRWGRPPFDRTQIKRGCANSVVGLELAESSQAFQPGVSKKVLKQTPTCEAAVALFQLDGKIARQSSQNR